MYANVAVTSAHHSWSSLGEIADLIEPESQNRSDFLEEARSGALDGVLVVYRTFASVSITGNFDEEIIEAMPASLKFVCHNGKPTYMS